MASLDCSLVPAGFDVRLANVARDVRDISLITVHVLVPKPSIVPSY